MKSLVRPAVASDVADIFTIRTAVKENALTRLQLTEMGITPEVILDMLTIPDCVWVAEVNDITAGFAIADKEEGVIFALFVLPEYQGLGLGGQLMNHAESALFEQFAQIWLETDSRSRAAAFYQQRGWQAVEQLTGNDKRYQKQRPEKHL